jgi:hypothetical protein
MPDGGRRRARDAVIVIVAVREVLAAAADAEEDVAVVSTAREGEGDHGGAVLPPRIATAAETGRIKIAPRRKTPTPRRNSETVSLKNVSATVRPPEPEPSSRIVAAEATRQQGKRRRRIRRGWLPEGVATGVPPGVEEGEVEEDVPSPGAAAAAAGGGAGGGEEERDAVAEASAAERPTAVPRPPRMMRKKKSPPFRRSSCCRATCCRTRRRITR